MPKQIIWAPLAENDLSAILEYLYQNWDSNVSANFIDLTENVIDQISNNPRQYPIIFNLKGNGLENVFSRNIILFFTANPEPE